MGSSMRVVARFFVRSPNTIWKLLRKSIRTMTVLHGNKLRAEFSTTARADRRLIRLVRGIQWCLLLWFVCCGLKGLHVWAGMTVTFKSLHLVFLESNVNAYSHGNVLQNHRLLSTEHSVCSIASCKAITLLHKELQQWRVYSSSLDCELHAGPLVLWICILLRMSGVWWKGELVTSNLLKMHKNFDKKSLTHEITFLRTFCALSFYQCRDEWKLYFGQVVDTFATDRLL